LAWFFVVDLHLEVVVPCIRTAGASRLPEQWS